MNLLYLTMLSPFLGFVILAISQDKWSKSYSVILGVGSVLISMLITVYVAYDFYCSVFNNGVDFVFLQEIGSWFSVSNFNVPVIFRLDKLSILMLLVITGIGFIIHLYSSWYMSKDEGYSRFFAYTNLFISSMILLVLSDNLLLMYFGWEVAGICSYLLIGFYYFNLKNVIKALYAFIMTRFGDIFLICAFFMIYNKYHTLNLDDLLKLKFELLCYDECYSNVCISFMLLIGAISKSAQIPFQNWLVKAMVGPTPVSALIHAATMVTAGVYLVARMNNFFIMAPCILHLIGIIGSVTLIIFGFSALFQSNIKKILAYSTISQLGYMFLALGTNNWEASIFHLIIHAACKALLFLSAGVVIKACKGEQNIFRMGGLYRFMPFVYICFMMGGASLSGFPLITSGFYSKEAILSNILECNDYFFLFAGLVGTVLTAMYVFRMIFVVFHGINITEPVICNNFRRDFSLGVLLFLSTFVGAWINFPMLNNSYIHTEVYTYFFLVIVSAILIFFGIWLASVFWLFSRWEVRDENIIVCKPTEMMERYFILLCYYGWGFDWFYKKIFIKPCLFFLKKIFAHDLIDSMVNVVLSMLSWCTYILKFSINGKLNWYVIFVNLGAIIILYIMLISVNI